MPGHKKGAIGPTRGTAIRPCLKVPRGHKNKGRGLLGKRGKDHLLKEKAQREKVLKSSQKKV